MPKSDFDFTFKFFHPPQRTVPCHNGLLDIRTKHTIAQDRLVVAEQRALDAERRRSISNLQSLALEQRQVEKKLASIHKSLSSTFSNRPLRARGRSTSEVVLRGMRRSSSWTETLPLYRSKLSVSLHNSNQNLLNLPKLNDANRRLSVYSDGDTPENPFFLSDMESGEEGEDSTIILPAIQSKRNSLKTKTLPKLSIRQNRRSPPIVAIIPPDDEVLFLFQ